MELRTTLILPEEAKKMLEDIKKFRLMSTTSGCITQLIREAHAALPPNPTPNENSEDVQMGGSAPVA